MLGMCRQQPPVQRLFVEYSVTGPACFFVPCLLLWRLVSTANEKHFAMRKKTKMGNGRKRTEWMHASPGACHLTHELEKYGTR
jgi:hypothetical protein